MKSKLIDTSRFAELIDGMYDEVCIWDKQMRIVYINKACERHYGLPAEYFIGKDVNELVGSEGLWSSSIVANTMEWGKPLLQRQKSSQGIEMTTISVPIFDANGEVEYVVQSVRDFEEALHKEVESVLVTEPEPANFRQGDFVYFSENMKHVVNELEKVATTGVPILILGETGVGKTYMAKHIYQLSDRRDRPFLTVNMASLSSSVIESELFGYEEGAFTGARKGGKKGLFEQAQGGTLFLDEIGDFPCELQAKFLHVLQEGEFIPVGGSKPVKFDARVIYATNHDLRRKVASGTFRQDLYQRINLIEVTIPPLRERPEDRVFLTNKFVDMFNEKYHRKVRLAKEVEELFAAYPWTGNVRELSNVIERSVILAENDTVDVKDLPETFFSVDYMKPQEADKESQTADFGMSDIIKDREKYEHELIVKAYYENPSSRKLAKALGVSQSTANRLIRKHIKK